MILERLEQIDTSRLDLAQRVQVHENCLNALADAMNELAAVIKLQQQVLDESVRTMNRLVELVDELRT